MNLFNFESGLTITDVTAILAGVLVVIKAIYDVVSKIKDVNKEERYNAAEASDQFADTAVKTAKLYREALADISTLREEMKALREECKKESNQFSQAIKALEISLAEKEQDYLLLKRDLAEKNEQISRQQEAISKSERLHAKWERGIEKLLKQMDEHKIKPDWTPSMDGVPKGQRTGKNSTQT